MARTFAWALSLLLCASAAHAETDAETIGGYDQIWWSGQARAHERAVESLEREVESCEESEAPRAYRDVPGQVFRGRDGLRYREVVHCDDLRADFEAAREALDEFENLARRLGVPPGWLR